MKKTLHYSLLSALLCFLLTACPSTGTTVTPDFSLKVTPSTLTLQNVGNTATAELEVIRHNTFSQPLSLELDTSSLPAGISITKPTLSNNQATVVVNYNAEVTIKDYEVSLTVKAGTTRQDAKLTIQVKAPSNNDAPIIQSFSATPTTVLKGSKTTLAFNVSNTDKVEILAANTSIYSQTTNQANFSGSQEHSPNTTTTYTLQASKGTQTITQSVEVTVREANDNDPVIVALSATHPTIAEGMEVDISYTVRNADSVSITARGVTLHNKRTNTSENFSHTFKTEPLADTTYTINAIKGDVVVSKDVTIGVTITKDFCTEGNRGGDIVITGREFAVGALERLRGCTSIPGSLGLYFGGVSNLEALSKLQEVGGNVTISVESIENLQGLNSLQSVGKNFSLRRMDTLSNLSGLEQLSEIKGIFFIVGNNSLTSLAGAGNNAIWSKDIVISDNNTLENLKGLEGVNYLRSLRLNRNNALRSLEGLNNLTGTRGNGCEYDTNDCDIVIENHRALTDMTALNSLASLRGSLVIKGNTSLKKLASFNNITTIIENLRIEANSSLTTMGTSFANLVIVGKRLDIVGNNALKDMGDFSSLATVGFLEIHTNKVLEHLDGLSKLTTVRNAVVIYDNDKLVSVKGLSELRQISAGIMIQENASLTNVDGFEGIKELGGHLDLTNNPKLNNLHAFHNIRSIKGALILYGNTSLESAALKFDELYVLRFLTIEKNSALTNLDGLKKLRFLYDFLPQGDTHAGLLIRNNATLESIAGLNDVQTISNINRPNQTKGLKLNLIIKDNPMLSSLKPLEGISVNAANLWIVNNDSLVNLEGITMEGYDEKFSVSDNDNLIDIQALSGLSTRGGESYITGNSKFDCSLPINRVGFTNFFPVTVSRDNKINCPAKTN